MNRHALLIAVFTCVFALGAARASAEVSQAGASQPIVEGLIDPKPGDTFGGAFWDLECTKHLDDATYSIAHAKLEKLILPGQCPLVFRDICTGIHPVVTVNGCSLSECQALVDSLCQQDRSYFEREQEGARGNL